MRLFVVWALTMVLILPVPAKARRLTPEKIKALYSVTVKVVTGISAVIAYDQGNTFRDIFLESNALIRELEKKGVNPRTASIYNLRFKVDPDTAGRWIFRPNVYALVQLEGQGDLIPASIAKGYSGHPWTVSFYGERVRPGGEILIHILDDRQFLNRAWNKLLQTEIPIKLDVTTVSSVLQVNIKSDWSFQILDKDITLSPPAHMAFASIKVPDSEDDIWMAKGTLFDAESNVAGEIDFSQIWTSSALQTRSSSRRKMFIFFGIAVVLTIVFVHEFKKKKDPSTGKI